MLKAHTIVVKQYHRPNHRIVEVGKYLWRPFGPTPMLKQGQLEEVAQEYAQQLLKVSKDVDSKISLGNFCLVTPSVVKCFLIFREDLLCFRLCPLPLVLALGTTERVWLCHLCTLPSGIYIAKIPLSLLFSRLNSSSSLSHSS